MDIEALELAAAQIPQEEILSVVESEGGSSEAYYIFKEPTNPIGVVHFIGANATPMQRWDDDTVFTYAFVKFLVNCDVPIFESMTDLLNYEEEIRLGNQPKL